MVTLADAQQAYNGHTLYLRSRTRNRGDYPNAEIREHDERTGCLLVVSDGVMAWYFPEEIHLTADERDATIKALRKPRTKRTPQPLYGDFAQLAALHGSGRVTRRSAR